MSALGSGEAIIDPVVLHGERNAKSDKATVLTGLKGKLLWMSAYWGF